MKIRVYFRWSDFWIGILYIRTFHILYIQLLPTIGIRIKLKPQEGE